MSAYTEIPKIKAENGELPPKVLNHLNNRYPGASSESVEYWVAPPPLGDDENDGSEDYPLATLAEAIAKLPDIIRAGHQYVIHINPGTWNETLLLENIDVLGHLHFKGTSTIADRHRIFDVRVSNVSGHITWENLWATKDTQNGPKFWFQRSQPFMEVINCGNELVPGDTDENGDGARGVHGLLADYGSKVSVQNCHFQGNRYAIRSNWFSQILSRDNTGDGNTHGIGARFGGIISLYGTQPTGTFVDTTASSGGIVVHSTGGELGTNAQPTDDNEEHLSLVSYDRQRSSPHHIITKRWSTRQGTQTYGISEIPSGQALQLAFRMNTHISVSTMINIEFSYHTGSSRHFTKCVANPVITQTDIRGGQVYDIATAFGSGYSFEDMVSIEHSGAQGIFYIVLKPNPNAGGVSAGQHGENIEMSSMRPYPAPTFIGASLVTV